MPLDTADTYESLPICSKCGWAIAGFYEIKQHQNCQSAAAGEAASALAARFPELASTKFGYGSEQLTFNLVDPHVGEPDKRLYVRFQCNNNKTFHLREVWCLDNLTADEAAGLVEAIADWRNRCILAKQSGAGQ